MNERIPLVVVLACAEGDKRVLPASIAALQRQLSPVGGELLLVAAPAAHESVRAVAASAGVRWIASECRLVPELWADGVRASDSDALGFLIPECIVRTGWARALLDALGRGAGAAGGYFALSAVATSTDAAVYFLRYAAFSDPERPNRDVDDVAGDNAIYSRAAMLPHAATFAHGFWEVDLHRRFRSEGVRMVLCGDAVAEFQGAPDLWAMARQRFTHGRHFGDWRARQGGRSPVLSLLQAPAVPVVLMSRIVRRTWRRAGERTRLLAALPALAVLSSAWALGELLGALAGRGSVPAEHRGDAGR